MEASEQGVVRLLTAVAIKSQVTDLVAEFELASGLTVDLAFDLNPVIPQRILAGEAFDVGMTNPGFVDALEKAGKVEGSSHAPFGRIPLAIGRRSEAPNALLASEEEVSNLLRQATSIAYTSEGTSGKTFLDVVARLGLLDEIAPRTLPMGAGEPVKAVASGDAHLAVAPLSTILAAENIEPVGIFPPHLNAAIDMSMFMARHARNPAGSARLLKFLADPLRDAFLAARGVSRYLFT